MPAELGECSWLPSSTSGLGACHARRALRRRPHKHPPSLQPTPSSTTGHYYRCDPSASILPGTLDCTPHCRFSQTSSHRASTRRLLPSFVQLTFPLFHACFQHKLLALLPNPFEPRHRHDFDVPLHFGNPFTFADLQAPVHGAAQERDICVAVGGYAVSLSPASTPLRGQRSSRIAGNLHSISYELPHTCSSKSQRLAKFGQDCYASRKHPTLQKLLRMPHADRAFLSNS